MNIKEEDNNKLKTKKLGKNNNDNKSNKNDNTSKEFNKNFNINPKMEKNKKKLNKKIKEEKEEIILIDDDKSITEESKKSEPYVKKIIQNKSVDKKGKKLKLKKIKEEEKNPVIKDIEIHINNKQFNINNNLSFSSNNDKGNFNQVLFDYKNFNEKKVPTKRKKDLDEEELKDIKYQKDLVEKQKKKGWIQKEEIEKGKNKKDNNKKNQGIKLETYINESIKENNNDNKSLNNSDISLLSLDKLNNKEGNKKDHKNQFEDLEIEKSDNSHEVNQNIIKNKDIEKSIEKSIDKGNSLDDLLMLDKITDFSHDNNLRNINNIKNMNEEIKKGNNNTPNKKQTQSQEGMDLDFSSNVQSKDKAYNFNNNLVLNNSQNKEKEKENILEEKNKKLSKFQEYLKFKKLNEIKNDNNDNIPADKNYELEIKTQEDQQTYDEFYKMNHNNRKSIMNNNKKKSNNNFIENIPENSRIKKEREKMKGHKCELCQKFYDCVNENEDVDFLCQECSRHRTDQPINKTPQGFYDLNI